MQYRGLSYFESTEANRAPTEAQRHGHTALATDRKSLADIVRNGKWKEHKHSEQWTLVQEKKLRNHFIGKIGKAEVEINEHFKAANISVPIYVYYVSKENWANVVMIIVTIKAKQRNIINEMYDSVIHILSDAASLTFRRKCPRKNGYIARWTRSPLDYTSTGSGASEESGGVVSKRFAKFIAKDVAKVIQTTKINHGFTHQLPELSDDELNLLDTLKDGHNAYKSVKEKKLPKF
ncbi:hypothetical protein ACJJTC_000627 [Scirpophaga incertulas]